MTLPPKKTRNRRIGARKTMSLSSGDPRVIEPDTASGPAAPARAEPAAVAAPKPAAKRPVKPALKTASKPAPKPVAKRGAKPIRKPARMVSPRDATPGQTVSPPASKAKAPAAAAEPVAMIPAEPLMPSMAAEPLMPSVAAEIMAPPAEPMALAEPIAPAAEPVAMLAAAMSPVVASPLPAPAPSPAPFKSAVPVKAAALPRYDEFAALNRQNFVAAAKTGAALTDALEAFGRVFLSFAQFSMQRAAKTAEQLMMARTLEDVIHVNAKLALDTVETLVERGAEIAETGAELAQKSLAPWRGPAEAHLATLIKPLALKPPRQ